MWYLKGQSTLKTLTHTNNLQNSIDFAKCAAILFPGITILYCCKTDVEEIKAALDNGTLAY